MYSLEKLREVSDTILELSTRPGPQVASNKPTWKGEESGPDVKQSEQP